MTGEVDEAEMGAFRRQLVRSFRERGAMTATEADLWLGGAGHSPTAFYQRLAELALAYRKGKRKTRIEDDDLARDIYDMGMKVKRENPQMAYERIAARFFVTRATWFRWHRRFRENPRKGTRY